MEKVAQSKGMKLTGRFEDAKAFRRDSRRAAARRRSAPPLASLEAAQELAGHPLGAARAEVKRVLLFCVTSSRGLCGGYNAKIIQAARARMEALRAEGREPLLAVMGRKGLAYFRYHDQPVLIADRRRRREHPVQPAGRGRDSRSSSASPRRSSTRWRSSPRATSRGPCRRYGRAPLLPFTPALAAAAIGAASVTAAPTEAPGREPLYLVEPDRRRVLAALLPAPREGGAVLRGPGGDALRAGAALDGHAQRVGQRGFNDEAADADLQQGAPGTDYKRDDRDHQRKRRGQDMSAGGKGTVIQVIGSILDAEFEEGHLPGDPQRPGDRCGDRRTEDARLVSEVQQHLGRQPRPRGRAGFHGRHPPRLPHRRHRDLHHGARGQGSPRPGVQPAGRARGRQGPRARRRSACPSTAPACPSRSWSRRPQIFETGIKVHRPSLPLRAGREDGPLRRRRGGQDRHHRGAHPQHRHAVRRVLHLRRRRRADARRQRPVEGDGRSRRSWRRPASSSAR